MVNVYIKERINEQTTICAGGGGGGGVTSTTTYLGVRFFVLLKFRSEFICFQALFLQLLTLDT